MVTEVRYKINWMLLTNTGNKSTWFNYQIYFFSIKNLIQDKSKSSGRNW